MDSIPASISSVSGDICSSGYLKTSTKHDEESEKKFSFELSSELVSESISELDSSFTVKKDRLNMELM